MILFFLSQISSECESGNKERKVKPFVCICCGEEKADQDQMDPGNPNVCRACVALAEELAFEAVSSRGNSASESWRQYHWSEKNSSQSE